MRTELRLLALVRPHWGMLLLSLAAASLASVLDSVTIVVLIPLLKHLFGGAGALPASATSLEVLADRLVQPLLAGAGPGVAVGRIALVLGAALLLKNALAYGSTQISVRVQEGLVYRLRTRLFAHLLTLHLGFFQRTQGGQLISTMVTEADQAKTVVTVSLVSFFQNAALVIVTLAVLSQISARLTLLVLVVLPPLVLVVRALLRRLRRHARVRTEERGEITAAITERIAAIRLLRTAATAEFESERFASLADGYRRKVIRTQRYSALTRPVSELFAGAIVILVVWAGANPAIIGLRSLAPEAIVVFLVAAIKLLSPLKALTQFPALMALALASAERVFALLDQPPADADRPGESDARFEREIVYDRVSYRYDGEHVALSDVSFAVPRGHVVALVGPSGAGKSTVIDLLPRLDDPTSGRILLDGVPLTALRRRSLRSLMGVVSQETVLLHDSVHANIAYGVPGATRAAVEAAARAANADEFIQRLPRGYDTPLGERGTRVSGGQRQRIAIARALLHDPPILLLDEATSALDGESELLLQQAIERLMEDRTVLVIAHRLATVRHADLIVVLDHGRIVQRGTHESLLAEGGLYGRLYGLEFSRFRVSAPALFAPQA